MNNAEFWQNVSLIIEEGFTEEGLQKLESYAEQFISKQLVYQRFSPQEQYGCATGGNTHVIATLLAGADVAANRRFQEPLGFKEECQRGKAQESIIECWARRVQCWYDDVDIYLAKLLGDQLAEGGEARVYQDYRFQQESRGAEGLRLLAYVFRITGDFCTFDNDDGCYGAEEARHDVEKPYTVEAQEGNQYRQEDKGIHQCGRQGDGDRVPGLFHRRHITRQCAGDPINQITCRIQSHGAQTQIIQGGIAVLYEKRKQILATRQQEQHRQHGKTGRSNHHRTLYSPHSLQQSSPEAIAEGWLQGVGHAVNQHPYQVLDIFHKGGGGHGGGASETQQHHIGDNGKQRTRNAYKELRRAVEHDGQHLSYSNHSLGELKR